MMKKIAQNHIKEPMQRVVTFLNRDEVDFLDKLGKDALFSTGLKLSRARLIAWLIDFAEKLKINGMDVKSEKDLEKKITRILELDTKTIANAPRQPRI
ncbi:MAG: hypothetical protein ABIC18_04750 [Candidatus Omnitrophota bacterium]